MLVGREAERAAVVDLLDSTRRGDGGSLVIRGVAGAGKSTLLADAVGSATGMRVLRTSGVESESPLAFAAMQRLLRPLRRQLDRLPKPQAAALGAALGEAEGEGDRFLAFLGVLSLLAEAAEDEPVLVSVDDAQWLDDASAAALLFVARRLQAERIALLFAVRDGEPSGFDARDLPTLTLGGISGDAAAGLLAGVSGAEAVDPVVRDRLVAGTGGNPLALVELASALTPTQLTGAEPLPSELPLTGGVERAFGERYRRLSDGGQRLLLVAAADDSGRLAAIRAAAARLGAADAALDEVERAGLLRVDGDVEGDTVTLFHPLVRSAVYRAATSAMRRAAHGALAEALRADPDRSTWHLAAATDQPDEKVVTALDGVAERAAGRGGHEAAAAAWARAAELTVDREARARRLYLAAQSNWAAGNPARAAGLARAGLEDATDELLRSHLFRLRGQIEWNTSSVDAGYAFVLDAVRAAATVNDAMARELAMLAASLGAWGARSADDVDPATLVRPLPADASDRERTVMRLLHGFAAVSRTDWASAAAAFREAMKLSETVALEGDFLLQPNLGMATLHLDDDDHGLRLHDQQLTSARRSGALTMAEHALTRGFHFQLATGAWSAAANAAAEGLALAGSTGDVGLTALPTAELALIEALRGETAAAGEHLASVDQIRERYRIGITEALVADYAHWARGLLEARQPAVALAHVKQLALPMVRRLAALDALEIAVRAGDTDLAGKWLAELADFADATRVPAAVAVAEHGRALLANDADAEKHFLAALTAHADSPRVPNRARTQLAFGEYLRRVRRRVDARQQLRAAHVTFEELGAGPWAARATQELRASGETARRREAASSDELTPQERQVAALVRQGLSNRDAAAQLFLSPRTVDFHLRNVFSKLGVSSRAELAALQLQ